MGRPPWASPEQLEFLEGFTPGLDEEKKKDGLRSHYDQIAQQFILKWPVTPTEEDRIKAGEKGDVQQEAVKRQVKVCYSFPLTTPYSIYRNASESTSGTKHSVNVTQLLKPSPSST
jgi:hypothetical protein